MDVELSPEQEEFRKIVRQFAEEVVAPRAEAMDRAEQLDPDVLDQMAELGLFGLPFPEELGGMGADYLTLCLAIEELARVDSSVAITLEAAVGLGAMPIWRFGSDEQRRQWLPPLARGERVAAFGLTEPGGGTDAGSLRTRAELDGQEWVVDGTKAFITNAGLDRCGLVLLAAATGTRPDGRPEVSNLLVPSGTPGYQVGRKYRKVGWHASDTRELVFQGCRVPAANLLGERGSGLANFLRTLEEGRIAVAALATGLSQGCVDECVRYARERQAFGQPIAQFQAVAFKIADMEARAHTSRLAWWRAAARLVAGQPFGREAAIAKLHASEAAVTCAREAVQVHGGYGYMEEFPVARFYRDAKILEIGEGTSEVMRILIARSLGL
ncbi:MAG TPA: acyl-CoA dehydrogenase family protein [Actinomycetes bacterium]|jgi:alkylation response protein AidB-like acyl-CoA dehydrogenase|nr:acyl-CoA dehydrogenase family protein [Actinomycetes bacterium]